MRSQHAIFMLKSNEFWDEHGLDIYEKSALGKLPRQVRKSAWDVFRMEIFRGPVPESLNAPTDKATEEARDELYLLLESVFLPTSMELDADVDRHVTNIIGLIRGTAMLSALQLQSQTSVEAREELAQQAFEVTLKKLRPQLPQMFVELMLNGSPSPANSVHAGSLCGPVNCPRLGKKL